MSKTIADVVDMKGMPFLERADGFEKDLAVLIDKWGVAPTASMKYAEEGVFALPGMRDVWVEPLT